MIKKIFFWDGRITGEGRSALYPPFHQVQDFQDENWICFAKVEAAFGPSTAIRTLEKYQDDKKNFYILTNFLQALNCDWIDSSELFAHGYLIKDMFYLWDKKQNKWRPIEEFTDKELRSAHNLAHMYLAGAFNI